MLEKLKKKLRTRTLAQLSKELGYHSPNTVRTWVDNGRIPQIAEARVKKYLARKGN